MDLTQEDLWRLRGMIQKVGWRPFMSHIGSIMAEQADKVKSDSEQDKALFHFSIILHNSEIQKEFDKCGKFDYKKMIDLVPEEFRKFIS